MNLEDSKKKETVRISKKDLLKLLSENERQAQQITELQTRMTEMLEEMRALKFERLNKVLGEDEMLEDPFPTYEPLHSPTINPNIYFDGSQGLNNGPRFGSNG